MLPAASADTMVANAILESVCQETRSACAQIFAPDLAAIVVTGSVARAEASIRIEGERAAILGDAEFLLVFEVPAAVPCAETLRSVEGTIEENLARAGITCSIDLGAVTPGYFRRIRPHIFAYELKTCGRVLAGPPHLLASMPPFSAHEIPLEDGWRLLCNRMIECLDTLLPMAAANDVVADYRKVKLYLDMATSYLLFVGAYVPTYRARAERLQELARGASAVESPIDLHAFAHRVETCTRAKLAVNTVDMPQPPSWSEAIADAQALWRWQLARLLGVRGNMSHQDLLSQWQRRQPLGPRLRGWLYVVRERGWHRSWRSWIRWLRLAVCATPRYLVYEAGCLLFFSVPRLPTSHEPTLPDGPLVRRLRQRLPVLYDNAEPTSGRGLAVEITQNYHHLLVGTRA